MRGGGGRGRDGSKGSGKITGMLVEDGGDEVLAEVVVVVAEDDSFRDIGGEVVDRNGMHVGEELTVVREKELEGLRLETLSVFGKLDDIFDYSVGDEGAPGVGCEGRESFE